MALNYKVLGQAAPSATTETDLYTVAASTQAIVSSITVANRSSSSAATFRISTSVGGGATANKDYLVYDANIAPNGIIILTIGVTLGATDKIRVYGSTANLSFNAYGSEIA